MSEIRNKVEESGLIQLDLAQFKPHLELEGVDIAAQLWQGLVIKEKEFRSWIKTTDWQAFQGKAVYVFCSADAIVPTWAYMLVAASLNGIAAHVTIGNKDDVERELIQTSISKMNLDELMNGKVIIKGCSDISDPAFAMVCLLNKLQPVVQSIMYGEPCSTVPIYKKTKERNEN
jgi:Protein of unknown function (DUF2480)